MKRIVILLITLILLFAASSNSFAAEQVSQPIDLLAVSASPGGSWYAIMGSLAELFKEVEPNINTKVTPGGSFANILRVASNEAQIGFTFPFWITQALEHSGDYAERPKIAEGSLLALAGGFGSSPLQFAVTKSFAEEYGIETVKDIVEKKAPVNIAVNVPGTHEPWSLEKILEFYGSSLEEIESWGGQIHYGGYTNSVQLMQDGHANCILLDINPPASPFVEILVSRDLKFIPLTQDAIDYMVEKQGHAYAVIPAGTYKGQDKEIPTATMLTILITNDKLPDEVAYTIVKILVENEERVKEISPALEVFDPEIAGKNLIAPLHPGAEKAYSEYGY